MFEIEKEAYPHVLKLLAAGRVRIENGRVTLGKPPRREGGRQADIPVD